MRNLRSWNNPPYYLTAYGLAVKHGFVGSEQQWLRSLRGDPGTGLEIIDSFDTYEDLLERYPGTVGIPEGFMKVGTTEDYLLYYWDSEDLEWYSIKIIGPDGADGESAYELAVQGGYPDSEEQFNADLAGFKADKTAAENAAAAAAGSATAAETAQTATETARDAAAGSAAAADNSAADAQGYATAAAGSAADALAARDRAETAAAQAEASVGDASWILFDIEEETAGKIGWLYCIEAETYAGPDFSVNDENGSHQGWLEVSNT